MSDWVGRKVVVIGAARQGIALARYLSTHGARVLVNDQKPAHELQAVQDSLADLPPGSVEWALGGHSLDILDGADLVCPSGGVPLTLPLILEAQRRGIPLSNDSQIFLEAAPCRVIGITGSAGKTTTTTLVGRMASASNQYTVDSIQYTGESERYKNGNGRRSVPQRRLRANRRLPKCRPKGGNLRSRHLGRRYPRRGGWQEPCGRWGVGGRTWVGGNIGSPLIAVLDEMAPGDLAVMELSSFQLELMTVSSQVAAVLNITPNHLDRHASMEEYTRAKARILEFQDPGETGQDCVAVLNRDDSGSWSLVEKVRGRLVSFGWKDPGEANPGVFLKGEKVLLRDGQAVSDLFPRSTVQLRGEHNLMNVLAAAAIACAAGLPAEAVRAGVEGFAGVPHRLEFVRLWKGASWYNDSIATAPERVIAAIRSFDEPLVLLVGGRDKNLPWDDFCALARRRVDHLVLFGEAEPVIWRALLVERQTAGKDWPFTVSRCTGLQQAVLEAARVAGPGDVILLSPGGTSFDEFHDFEDRGEAYRKWVKRLT